MKKYYEMLELDKVFSLLSEKLVLEKNILQINNLQPFTNLELLENRLSEVDEATLILQRMGRFPLYFSVDITHSLQKTTKAGILTIEEIIQISRFLDSVRDCKLFLDELIDNEIVHHYFKNTVDTLIYEKELNLHIKKIINKNGQINDDASSELARLRRLISNTETNIQKRLQEQLEKNADKLSQSIISIRNDRYVIPVKNDYKNAVKGIIHDQSASGETVFIEPQIIIELNNKLNSYRDDEEKEIMRILRDLSLLISAGFDSLFATYHGLIHLDLIFGKAQLALDMGANKPKLNNDGIIDLINCHHPLLNVENIISNNITLGRDYQAMIITGPNTGGKTVLLKTLGLLSLMTKYGLLIPADENSEMTLFDNVYADIGDEQSIDQNLSTFSSHLNNVIKIINQVTDNSLVLLDELGSGTDPIEGSSLAIAILEYLLAKKCLIITTSHYSDLKLYGFSSKKIINASVEFNLETLAPTYKLLIGVPGQSHALNISKMLGLKDSIINRAKDYSFEKSDELDNILAKLINQTHTLDEKLTETNQKIAEYEALKEELTIKIAQIKAERQEILALAEKEAKKQINEKLVEANKLIEKLEAMHTKEVKLHEIIEAKTEAKQIKDLNIVTDEEKVADEFKINEHVFITNYQNYGIIIKVNKNNIFDVQIGNATVKVNKKYLRKTEKKPKSHTPQKTSTRAMRPTRSVSAKLDLRGKRYEEAQDLLSKYIDDCVLSGLQQVTIVHGYGTGTIRNLVRDFLNKHNSVESFRYGGAGEGGSGATVVTIKNN